MSLESSIDNLAQAIQALASAINPNTFVKTLKYNIEEVTTPEAPSTTEAPRRTRRSKEQIAADEAAKQQPVPTIEEDFLPEETPAVTFTENDVRAALMALRTHDGSKDRAVHILKKHTGQEVVPGIPATSYAGIIADCQKAMV